MKKERKISLVAKILLFATTLMWGASFFILKNTLKQIPVFTLIAIRFAISIFIMLIIFFPKFKKVNKTVVWKGLWAGVFLGIAYIVSGFGMKNTTPANGAFLVSTYAVMVPFMLWVATKKRPAIYSFVAVFICLIGIGLITLQHGFKFNFKGDGITLIAAVALAINMVQIAVFSRDEDVMLLTTFQYIPSLVVSIIGMLIFERGQAVFTPESIGGMLYLAIPCTVMALGFISFGLKNTSAVSAGLILSLEAVFGAIFSIIFYKEKITPISYIAFAVIFIAVFTSEVLPLIVEMYQNKKALKNGESLITQTSKIGDTSESEGYSDATNSQEVSKTNDLAVEDDSNELQSKSDTKVDA